MKKTRKIIKRKCVACNKLVERNELYKIVVVDNELIIDKNYNIKSRSFYVEKNNECLKTFINKKLLDIQIRKLKLKPINVQDFKEVLMAEIKE